MSAAVALVPDSAPTAAALAPEYAHETIARLQRERDEARQAVAEILPYITDINNREARGTTAWHVKHAATVEASAVQFGFAHMLSASPHYTLI